MGELIILDYIDKLNTDKLTIISVLVQSEVIHTSWCYIHCYTELSSYPGFYYCRTYIYLSYYNLCTNEFKSLNYDYGNLKQRHRLQSC